MFSLYINDVEDYLLDKNVAALFIITKRIQKELFYIFNFFIPFYADNTVILAESAYDLQFAFIEFIDTVIRGNLL